MVRVRSVDEAEEVNAEADKDAAADKRTFAPDVEAIAKGGLAKALPEVDARLRLAMRGESAGAQSDTDADALTANSTLTELKYAPSHPSLACCQYPLTPRAACAVFT